jgi:spore germination protein YaaH
VITHCLRLIPPEKISIGLPFYYWRWDDAAMKRVGIGGNAQFQNLVKDYKLKFGYDADEQAPYFHFWEKGKSYTGWYENAKSIGYKISLLKKYNLRGFSAWALGLEHPTVFNVI